MKLQEIFEAIDIGEINRYISEQQEEHLHLEFKTVNHPYDIDYDQKKGKASYTKEDAKNADKKNISKTLSGFANSSGGIVIWGIKTQEDKLKPDVAEKLVPIKELTKFLTLLNRLESDSVTPPIDGVVHTKIDLGNDTGYVKTHVPASESAPHMANYADKHYYKRSGDSFHKCEHYEIMDILNRKKFPKVELVFYIEDSKVEVKPALIPDGAGTREIKYNKKRILNVSVKNAGNVFVNYLNCYISISKALLDKTELERASSLAIDRSEYLQVYCDNTIREYKSMVQTINGGRPEYWPARYEPILPQTEFNIKKIKLNRDIITNSENQTIYYTVHADNAPKMEGEINIETILIKVVEYPTFKL